jgi:NapD protein
MSSRRDFIRGQWKAEGPEHIAQQRRVEIVSLIVCTWPKHLEAVADAILALGNAEIRGRDPKGKLIVVLEEPGCRGRQNERNLGAAACPVRGNGVPGQRRRHCLRS